MVSKDIKCLIVEIMVQPQIHFFGKISFKRRNSSLKDISYHNMLIK